jgi:hypothetical protein
LYSVPNEIAAAARARWLAELSAALDAALGLLPELILVSDERSEIVELYARLEALRRQAMSLRSCPSEAQFNPDWTWYDPWTAGQEFP